MCVGITFSLKRIEPIELDRFFTREEFAASRQGELAGSFYWQRRPFLPVEEAGRIHLYDWGNRAQDLKLPKTGWAKVESVRDGLWDWLSPKMVTVPSVFGCEKKKWFQTPNGVKAIKVRYHNVIRVYLLTAKATREFILYTGHDRMPIGEIKY